MTTATLTCGCLPGCLCTACSWCERKTEGLPEGLTDEQVRDLLSVKQRSKPADKMRRKHEDK